MSKREMRVKAQESEPSVYQRIYALVRAIPPGKVASYGQIAALVAGCTARMVGYAMAALPGSSNVPWHRVINSQGAVSPRRGGDGGLRQRFLLEKEGLRFNRAGKLDLAAARWDASGGSGLQSAIAGRKKAGSDRALEGAPTRGAPTEGAPTTKNRKKIYGASTTRKRVPSKVAK
jgi:methylated-DNA-protein-cysteine methyltransferase related protein